MAALQVVIAVATLVMAFIGAVYLRWLSIGATLRAFSLGRHPHRLPPVFAGFHGPRRARRHLSPRASRRSRTWVAPLRDRTGAT
ncbi:MAG TPA: hypothetical protein GX510_09750 [Firmicutes bacterium]|nr:hypothetical protein [Candidatus Fermentithermobacillaceae bacterium]